VTKKQAGLREVGNGVQGTTEHLHKNSGTRTSLGKGQTRCGDQKQGSGMEEQVYLEFHYVGRCRKSVRGRIYYGAEDLEKNPPSRSRDLEKAIHRHMSKEAAWCLEETVPRTRSRKTQEKAEQRPTSKNAHEKYEKGLKVDSKKPS